MRFSKSSELLMQTVGLISDYFFGGNHDTPGSHLIRFILADVHPASHSNKKSDRMDHHVSQGDRWSIVTVMGKHGGGWRNTGMDKWGILGGSDRDPWRRDDDLVCLAVYPGSLRLR